MGFGITCSYVYKCEHCGQEGSDSARQDGSGEITRLHASWEEKRCECGGHYLLCDSEAWGEETGVVHRDIPKYFNSGSDAWRQALLRSLEHELPSVSERAGREFARYFSADKAET